MLKPGAVPRGGKWIAGGKGCIERRGVEAPGLTKCHLRPLPLHGTWDSRGQNEGEQEKEEEAEGKESEPEEKEEAEKESKTEEKKD